MNNMIAEKYDCSLSLDDFIKATRVLVVADDKSGLADLAGFVGENLNVQVDCAQSGEYALELCSKYKYALAFMDTTTDGVDVYGIASSIRSSAPNTSVPIIFISGEDEKTHMSFRGYEAGAVDSLSKPVDRVILLSKARVFIELYNQRKELEFKTRQLASANTCLEASREELALSNEKLEKIVENVSEMMFSLSPDGVITFAAKSVKSGLGFESDELTGNSFFDLVSEDSREGLETFLAQLNIMGEPDREHEVEALDASGNSLWLSLSVSPVLDASGDLISFVVLALDITERRMRDQSMEISVAMAEVASMGVVEINDELEKLNDELTRSQEALRKSNELLSKKQEALNKDLAAAAGIQRSLLPSDNFQAENMDIAWIFKPSAMVGGDLLGLYNINEKHLVAYVLDVAGHGVGAALVSVTAHQFFQPQNRRVISNRGILLPPVQVLEELNREFPLERFGTHFTVFYMVLELATGKFRYSSAGHNPALLVAADGESSWLKERGSIIGLEGIPFEGGHGVLKPGDSVLLYTDGVVEMMGKDREQFGEERFVQASVSGLSGSKPIAGGLDEIYSQVLDFGQGDDPADDLTMLGLKYLGG